MAKLPKKMNRFCPYCKKKTEQKVKQVSSGTKRGAMKRGAKERMALRGIGIGIGNKGKLSKGAVKSFKKTTKTTKKPQLLYTCSVCGKSKNQKKGKRTGKLIIE